MTCNDNSTGIDFAFSDPVGPDQMLATPQSEAAWLWEGFIPAREITLLTGYWKAGKTTLLIHMLRAWQTEQKFFCGRRLNPATVLIVSQESTALWNSRLKKCDLTEKVLMFQRGKNNRPSPYEGPATPQKWQALCRHLALQVRRHRLGLVVIDPISTFWAVANENDAGEVRDAFLGLEEVTEAGAAVLLLHHPTKNNPQRGRGARGSGVLPASVAVSLEFQVGKGRTRRLHYSGWYEASTEAYEIELTEKGYVASCSEVALLAVLPAEPPGITIEDMQSRWPQEGNADAVRKSLERRLKKLKANKQVGSTGEGVKGDPYCYYRIPDKSSR